ncbi:hypothetical protein BJ170DRAFT_603294 [Xylariales sp. AK1849]|nr:hypothetical protein BJ170DRAFT_603294 [Xylariales sp. AK1849]
MVHITPAFTPKSAPTISTTEAAPMTELDKSVTKSDADQPDVMTGNMFCLATNRQHNVYTPCPRTHTSQTGMVEATAVPNAVVESTAKGQESSNPLALLKNAMVMIRRSVAIHIGALSQAANDAKVVVEGKCYHSHARELLDENHKLKEGLEYALQVVRMQQELLDSQHRVIEDQRSSIEELTKLWVSLQTERLLGRSTSNHNMNN